MRTDSDTKSNEKETDPTKNRGEKEVNAKQDKSVGTAFINKKETKTAIATAQFRYL